MVRRPASKWSLPRLFARRSSATGTPYRREREGMVSCSWLRKWSVSWAGADGYADIDADDVEAELLER